MSVLGAGDTGAVARARALTERLHAGQMDKAEALNARFDIHPRRGFRQIGRKPLRGRLKPLKIKLAKMGEQ
ncbi:hypothetical protein [Xanthobacter sediminis]